ncbi:transglutaminase domain-containing protein [candidate division KSB1 bacterium]|nr:transglutaminase domain-containing protein [candidate division KSB1 bacterium]
MRKLVFLSLVVSMIFCVCGQQDILQQAQQLEKAGQLKAAQQLIHQYLQENACLDAQEKIRLRFAVERLQRLPHDYTLTREQMVKIMQDNIADVTPAELERWENEGRFDWILIEGEKRYHYASRSNLFFQYPELNSRRINPPDDSDFERAILQYCRQVKRAGVGTGVHYVLPQRFRAAMHLSVDADVVPAGETVRCWLPYPRAYPFQTDIRLISSDPLVRWIAEPFSYSRSIYMEKEAEAGEPVDFHAQFEYTSYATCSNVDADIVRSYEEADGEWRLFLDEKPPHIVFTPELHALAEEIVGDEKNPYLQARRIYDWVAKNIAYSYMIEYSLIDNLSMYAYRNRYGDCGVQGLLFITLCRIVGVPARWQGCWMFFPGEKTIHDWAEFYVHPYGWLPCDPYEGSWVEHDVRSLNEDDKRFLLDFYFCNMTAYRMIANADFSAPLYPPKNDFRSDMIDFQRGEVEWGNTNIYFHQRSFSWTVEKVE